VTGPTEGEKRDEYIHNNGRAKLRGLKPGRYSISIFTEHGARKVDRDATLAPGAETTIEVNL
jgi:uncharacterized protein (DUF2141 family)